MKCDCLNIIKDLVEITTLDELINHLESLIQELNKNPDKELENKLTKEIRKQVIDYRKWFKNHYPDIHHLCIYPEDKPFLYICSIIDELKIEAKRKFELSSCLEMCKELLVGEFTNHRGLHISFEEEISIIYLAQEKFRFLDILDTCNEFFHLYNLPFTGKFDACNIMAREYPNHMVFEFSLYDQNHDDTDNTLMYTTLLGRILNYVLVGNLNECPYGMIRTLNLLSIKYLEKGKDGGPIIFSSLFAIALLYKTKYDERLLSDSDRTLGLVFCKYIHDIIDKLSDFKVNDNSVELGYDEPCPCESGKKYGECCSKKRMKWVKKNGAISKKIPLDDVVIENLEILKKDTNRVLGRTLKNSEKIFSFSVGPDLEINKIIKLMKKSKLPMDKIYATYKTELILNDLNVDLVPDYELENWQNAINEYHELVHNVPEGSISYIEFINRLNNKLTDLWETYLYDSSMLLNMFINDIKEDYFLGKNFMINNIYDFLVFCARRVTKNVKALYETLKNEHYEISMSIVRMLYEDLININVYMSNPDMFEKHIKPIILIDKGIYQKLVDDKGNISNKTAIDPKTNERFNYSITLKDLSKKASHNYELLYEELFKDLSSYTHLNIYSKKSYFASSDSFFELDSCNIAGMLGVFFVNQMIYEFSKVDKISDFAYRDLLYFSDKVKAELNDILVDMMEIDENKNRLLEILLDCVSDFDILK